jgi:signal transduction histidine kinase
VLACGGYTVAVVLVPGLNFAYPAAGVRIGIETAAAAAGLMAAYLLVGRYQLGGRVGDLALFGGLLLLSLCTSVFRAVPAQLSLDPTPLTTWGMVAGRLLAALAITAAAFAPDLRLASPRRAGTVTLLSCVGAIGLIALGIVLLGTSLPSDGGSELLPQHSDSPEIDAAPGFLVVQLVTMLLYVMAAVGFTLRAIRRRDELVGWFAVAATVAAFSRLDYLLFPTPQTDWVFAADFLRFPFYLIVLVGALREVRQYQRQVALAAVLDERRRLARDLHDGLAQDLAWLSMQTRRLARGGSLPRLEQLSVAAECALDESRQAISALTRRGDDPFDAELSQIAERLADRAGARLWLDLDPDVQLPPARRDHLLRIVREAITNAVHHGGARTIFVELKNGDGVRLKVRDDGRGFNADAATGPGFGLTSMRERAVAMGGALEVRSHPDGGTEVEVVVP